LTLDKYIRHAKNEGLITEPVSSWFQVTDKGYEYLVAHNIIEG